MDYYVFQELMFCETCDCVFCDLCSSGPHTDSPCDHTIIPFSIAIKRMSEILLYKANECLSKVRIILLKKIHIIELLFNFELIFS